jgi:hypothetical protein
VEDLLQALVRRDRGAHSLTEALRILGGGLLAEEPEQVGGPFEVRSHGRVRDREQSHHHADHDGIDPRRAHSHPRDRAEREVHDSVADAA